MKTKLTKRALADEMHVFKQSLVAELEKNLPTAPSEAPEARYTGACADKWTDGRNNKFGRVRIVTGIAQRTVFQLEMFSSRAWIEEIIRRAKRLPEQVSSNVAVTRGHLPDPDETDAALDIYGSASVAADRLQAQLDRADDLEIEQKKRWKLGGIIDDLRARAAVTSEPAKQRTAIVEPLLKEAAERAEEERNVRRQVAASQRAESDSRMPELRRLIAEHKARNAELGIANETDTLQCNYAGLPREVPSPLLFDVAYSRGYVRDRFTKNTKHNGKIRELQRSIATSVLSSLYDRRTKRVDLTKYWIADSEQERKAA